MQGWQYGKGLIYLGSMFRLTKLASLRARVTLKEPLLRFEFKFKKEVNDKLKVRTIDSMVDSIFLQYGSSPEECLFC